MSIEEFCKYTGFVNFIYGFPFSIFILLKNPTQKINQIFALFAFFVSFWSFGYFCFHSYNYDYEAANFWIRFLSVGCIPIPAVFFHFVLVFLEFDQKHPYRKLLWLVYLIAFFNLAFVPTEFLIRNLEPKYWYRFWPNPGPVWNFYTLTFIIIVGFAHYLLFKEVFKTNGMRKKQILLIAIGTAITFLSGSTNFFLWYDIPIPPVLNALDFLYIVFVFYAVLNYRFLGVEDILAIHRDKLMLLGLMSSSLTHEIKNPLFLVKGYTEKIETLAGKKNDTEISDAVSKLSSQVSRMSTLVTRLSDFGKPNPHPGTPEEVDVAQVLDDALFFAEQELRHHNIELVKKIDSNLPKLQGDKSQFEEIFLNLIVNAFHSMKTGGKLTISAQSTLHTPQSAIEISVIDSGHGISKENLKNIFKPFYSTKGKQGTGLGLHIVKTLVEQNGGKISVESEVGKGTKFKLEFKA